MIKVKIGGIGGQGVQFFGKLLGESAFKQGLNISMGVNYEPATSGGLTSADVTIAAKDREIYYPFIEEPDILIVFAQRAWNEYKALVSKHTIIIADLDNVKDFHSEESKIARAAFHIPFSQKAIDLGSEKTTNVIILGFLSELLDIADNHFTTLMDNTNPEDAEEHELLEVDPQYFEDSLIKSSPSKFREMNLNAFKMGYEMSQSGEYQTENFDLSVDEMH